MKNKPVSLLALSLAACSTYAPISAHRTMTASSWPALESGSLVVVLANEGCFDSSARGSLFLDDASLARKKIPEYVRRGEAVSVRGAEVSATEGVFVVQVRTSDGQERFVGIKGASSCLAPVKAAQHRRMEAGIGAKFLFSPWRPACTDLIAQGKGASTVLFESEAGAPLTMSSIRYQHLDGEASPLVAWVGLSQDLVRLPLPIFERCFVEGHAEVPSDARAALHVQPDQCLHEKLGPATHLACLGSVGVWVGKGEQDAVNLRLAYRTLGPVHFLGSKLVEATPFAAVRVAVNLATPRATREELIYQALRRAIDAEMKKQAGAVRLVNAAERDVTLTLDVSLSDVNVGDVKESSTTETRMYRDHQVTVPNPDKASAESEVRQARHAVEQAEQGVKEAQSQLEESRRQATELERTCREQTNKAAQSTTSVGGVGGVLAGTSLGVGGALACNALTRVSDAPLQSARSGLESARNRAHKADEKNASTPATKKEWVMAPHSYSRTVFSRPLSARITLVFHPAAGEPETQEFQHSDVISTSRVEADPRHEVDGVSPDPVVLGSPDPVAALAAPGLTVALTERLRKRLHGESLAMTLKQLRESGDAAEAHEYETLDAAAFAIAGKRLEKVARRGLVDVGPNGTRLPTQEVSVSSGKCAVVVAVPDHESSAGGLWLGQESLGYADAREGASAVVEVCQPEAMREPFVLKARQPGRVRWSVYRLR